MNKKFYPITILEKNGSYIASITELGITTKGQTYNQALEACIFEKDKTIKMLTDKKTGKIISYSEMRAKYG